MAKDNYTCEVLHFPGFTKPLDPQDSRAKYGQHCLELGFVCKNGRGAVVLQVMTGWYPFTGVIGESGHYNVRMCWHLPVPTNPLEYADQTVQNCNIINQQCIGSSHMDHDGLWMKMLCYSTKDHFWNAMKKFHTHMTCDGEWNPKTDLVPNRLHLEKEEQDEDNSF